MSTVRRRHFSIETSDETEEVDSGHFLGQRSNWHMRPLHLLAKIEEDDGDDSGRTENRTYPANANLYGIRILMHIDHV